MAAVASSRLKPPTLTGPTTFSLTVPSGSTVAAWLYSGVNTYSTSNTSLGCNL